VTQLDAKTLTFHEAAFKEIDKARGGRSIQVWSPFIFYSMVPSQLFARFVRLQEEQKRAQAEVVQSIRDRAQERSSQLSRVTSSPNIAVLSLFNFRVSGHQVLSARSERSGHRAERGRLHAATVRREGAAAAATWQRFVSVVGFAAVAGRIQAAAGRCRWRREADARAGEEVRPPDAGADNVGQGAGNCLLAACLVSLCCDHVFGSQEEQVKAIDAPMKAAQAAVTKDEALIEELEAKITKLANDSVCSCLLPL
jgi:hypothetical protein